MRDDQAKRIDDLSETLMDTFLEDADPKSWPGASTPTADMTAAERGDRNWTLKNANQLGALLARTLDLRDRMSGKLGPASTPADDAADADIASYEKTARKLLEKVRGG